MLSVIVPLVIKWPVNLFSGLLASYNTDIQTIIIPAINSFCCTTISTQHYQLMAVLLANTLYFILSLR